MRPDTNERPRLPVLEQLRDEFLRRLLAEQHAMAEGSFGQRGGLVGGSAADCGLGAQRGEEQALARRAASYFAAPAFRDALGSKSRCARRGRRATATSASSWRARSGSTTAAVSIAGSRRSSISSGRPAPMSASIRERRISTLCRASTASS